MAGEINSGVHIRQRRSHWYWDVQLQSTPVKIEGLSEQILRNYRFEIDGCIGIFVIVLYNRIRAGPEIHGWGLNRQNLSLKGGRWG